MYKRSLRSRKSRANLIRRHNRRRSTSMEVSRILLLSRVGEAARCCDLCSDARLSNFDWVDVQYATSRMNFIDGGVKQPSWIIWNLFGPVPMVMRQASSQTRPSLLYLSTDLAVYTATRPRNCQEQDYWVVRAIPLLAQASHPS